ncbi:MAG: hypothetical protein WCZ87_02365 [Thiohalobacteraceae bacterium]
MKQLPRGIRNFNPGNIELGDPWQGMADRQTDGRFAQFKSPAYGIRAIARTLITYQDKHGIRTVTAAINRWAPPVENDTGEYVRAVQRAVGGDLVDMHDYQYLRPLVEAIIRHENGVGPMKTANTWYDAATIDEGLRMAGVRPPATQAVKVPVTKETVGASATGAVGALELADALPTVVAAVKSSEDHLSSGQMVRIVIGVFLVAAAVFIAYGQVKKHKSGVL